MSPHDDDAVIGAAMPCWRPCRPAEVYVMIFLLRRRRGWHPRGEGDHRGGAGAGNRGLL